MVGFDGVQAFILQRVRLEFCHKTDAAASDTRKSPNASFISDGRHGISNCSGSRSGAIQESRQ